MQQETATTPTSAEAPPARFLDHLRIFAQQHRDLAKRNYEAFARQYGKPTDRLRDLREAVKTTASRWRTEAREGYTKLDRDVEAKTHTNGKVEIAKAGNGTR